MTTAAFTDRVALQTVAYADERKLETRRAIYDHRRPPLDLVGEVVHRLGPVPTGVVADVGTGSGAYAKALRAARPDLTVLAIDLSPGMVAAAGQPGLVADAMRLPLPDASCVGVLALHMLYHVPDPAAAVAEYARVLRTDGSCVIAGNGPDDKHEFTTLWKRATLEVTGTADHRALGAGVLPFTEMDALARDAFPVVERVEYFGQTVVPDAEPVIAFLGSVQNWTGNEEFSACLERAGEIVRETVAREGAFTFTNHLGVIRARQC